MPDLPAFRDPEREDVVVFRPPHDPARVYVKRVVGLPGDTLEMRQKELFLNGVPQEEEYVLHLEGRGDAVHPGMKWQSDFLAVARTERNVRAFQGQLGPPGGSSRPVLRPRRQPGQQRGLPLLGFHRQGGHSRATLVGLPFPPGGGWFSGRMVAEGSLGSGGPSCPLNRVGEGGGVAPMLRISVLFRHPFPFEAPVVRRSRGSRE